MSRLAGKCALVTGGSSGIGKAIAEKLAADGARVVTAQRGQDFQFECIGADLADPAEPEKIIAAVMAKTGRLDILINNAGIMLEGTAEEMSLADWQKTISVNLTAPFLLTKYAIAHLTGGGAIVNIGSIEGFAANPRHPAYCASKAGLHGLTRAVAIDHGPQQVRCNTVAPGWIDTDLNDAFVDAQPDPDAFRNRIGALHPIGRTGHPLDVAALVAFLASDDAAFITGQIYTIDGGRTAKLPLP